MGRKIEISFGFMALVCILAWVQMELCALFLLAILVHELGHLLAMKLCGISIEHVSVKAAGAVIYGVFRSYRHELLCAAAGPVSSMLLAILSCRLLPVLSIASGLLGLVNLLPLYPLDGGRILRAALLMHGKEEIALRICSRTAFVLCGILMLGACWITVELQAGIWPIFAALVILCRAGEAWRSEL